MRCHAQHRRGGRLRRAVIASVLVGLGLTLAPPPAALAEEPTTSSTSTDTRSTTSTAPAEPVTALVALASARSASVHLRGASPLDRAGADTAADLLDTVMWYLNPAVGPGPTLPPDSTIDLAQLEADVQEAIRTLAGPTTIDLTGIQQRVDAIVAPLVTLATHAITDAVNSLPTPADVSALATQIEDALRAQAEQGTTMATTAASVLLDALGAWVTYLTDPQHQRTAGAAVATLLVALGQVVNPVPDVLAPTAEAGFTAARDLHTWADDLVQQGATGPGPFYDSTDTDTDEPSAPDANVLDDSAADTDIVAPVAEEPVVVPGPVYVTKPGPVTDVTVSGVNETVTSTTTTDCGMRSDETCAPPMSWRGGQVIQRPKVRVVLAGSWWNGSGRAADLRAGFASLFSGMSGSPYMNVLHQYYDVEGYIGTAVDYQGQYVVPGDLPDLVTDTQVGSYAVKASRAVPGWTTSDSVVWVVALPPHSIADPSGLAPHQKCGYQGYVTSGSRRYIIAEVDYPRASTSVRPGCDFIDGNPRGSATTIAAHEFVGAVTNPFMTGWYDSMDQHLPDLCRMLFIDGPGGEKVSKLWSNGDARCVSSFTPNFSYRVSMTAKPVGDAEGSTYTRGHSYGSAVIRAKNTGNMPWLGFGAKKTYLGTADNACSAFTDRISTAWASCRRVLLTNNVVPARSSTEGEFVFPMRPDGSLNDGETVSETFRLIAGSTWMTNTGSTSARIGGMTLRRFAATAITPPTTGYVAVGTYGSDTSVNVTIQNTGTAPWYPREVLYIGTPISSPYAATGWPRGPGGCRTCRAHRVAQYVAPGGTYTFPLTLHLPDKKPLLLEKATFYAYVDVERISDRSIDTTRLGAKIEVQIVLVPSPVGPHDLYGIGLASSDSDGVPVGTSGFTCAAVSHADARSTSLTSCTASVTTANGATITASAPSITVDGAVALTTGSIPYDGDAGDVITVCWQARTDFLDGTSLIRNGCTT